MSFEVCMGAQLSCSFGTAPAQLMVLPLNRVLTSHMPAANIMDHIPLVNILPFAMCTSIANPTVAAATTAAFGVLTPMPCIPVVPAPWTPGNPTLMIGNQPCISNSSTCMCAWGGMISVMNAGQTTVNV
ncbi:MULTISPECIES: DUF4280 domain-containing protein [Mesonia]|uniref:Uncharacterized protein n=1 Tax=Mesonia oceanica TaxID=2687242 RepID=A0AC61Y3Y9_9FLAO|nr:MULTISPECIES: DUF4280 domain-containing protein [Mesonia]MAN28786.1 hypothetical protein [Mesonia sp.]MAQ41882.1 hypothetical protein [Mesonia sp.]MBJ98995.1 hypothetical protein [Flavobacteriaceae bacterium]VVU99193.1 hypothetical protein FVB9532_00445 [Mesonia oceanica]|tara:strand:- start:28851 stop:29237 length:387 start_codon:yes stop_codon:yes gene_type:complete